VKISLFRSGVTVLVAAATAAGFAGTTARTAHAAPFQSALCPSGAATVASNGSSLQYNGVNAVATSYNGGTPCPGGGTVQVAKGGSGLCVTEATSHAGQTTAPNTVAASFCGTDIPYTDQQWATAIVGGGTNASLLETIPVAVAAVAVPYNESCAGTGVHITGAQLSGIYSGTIKDWNAITSACPVGSAIKVAARSVSSGTTATFKDYLFKNDPVTWANFHDSSTSWPAGVTIACSGPNNSDLATCVSSNPGMIAYVDFSDASNASLTDAAVTNAAGGFSTPGSGACSVAAQAGAVPPSTLLDFGHVSITDSPQGYGICTYTYQLAFVTPVQAGLATAAQAGVVRAFISYEVSDAGQAIFAANKYDPLPLNVQAESQAGAAALTSN
jgi:ABC-type phosphate transport system substrate-binding protein